MTDKLTIELMHLHDIKPYENNPRDNNEIAVDKVAHSITEFGFNVPIVLDKDNVIICGHTRYLAAKKIGLNKVPAIIAIHLNVGQVKAYRIADNRVALESTWEDDLLKNELTWLDSAGDLMHDLFTGFDALEIANILEPLEDFMDEKEPEPNVCPHCGKEIP